MSAIVLGGGPSGAAAACLLARAGRAVHLVERSAAPTHKLCGEFLSREAQVYLAGLGIDLPALGAAPITHLRLVQGDRAIETELPFRGFGLTRRALDEALLGRAAALGAEIARGTVVRRVAPEQDRLALEIEGDDRIVGDLLFLASGKHGVRGVPRGTAAQGAEWLGFKTYFRLGEPARDALAGRIELVLFRGGYAGLQLVEDGLANLCLLVRRSAYRAAGGGWEEFLAALLCDTPHLRARLAGATPQLDRPLAVARLPYGFVHRPAEDDPPGLFRLGDQAGIIEPFAGDGISIALHSAHVAVAAHLERQDAREYHRRLRQDIAGPIRRARLLSAAARRPIGGAALIAAAAVCPALLRGLASWTRLPH